MRLWVLREAQDLREQKALMELLTLGPKVHKEHKVYNTNPKDQ